MSRCARVVVWATANKHLFRKLGVNRFYCRFQLWATTLCMLLHNKQFNKQETSMALPVPSLKKETAIWKVWRSHVNCKVLLNCQYVPSSVATHLTSNWKSNYNQLSFGTIKSCLNIWFQVPIPDYMKHHMIFRGHYSTAHSSSPFSMIWQTSKQSSPEDLARC